MRSRCLTMWTVSRLVVRRPRAAIPRRPKPKPRREKKLLAFQAGMAPAEAERAEIIRAGTGLLPRSRASVSETGNSRGGCSK